MQSPTRPALAGKKASRREAILSPPAPRVQNGFLRCVVSRIVFLSIYGRICIMSISSGETAGFNKPRPTDDPYVAKQYDVLGIGDTPSLQDIGPHAISMMREKKVLEAMGLVLGRRLDARDAQTDPDLGLIQRLAMQDPEQAFGGLLLKLTLEELEAGR